MIGEVPRPTSCEDVVGSPEDVAIRDETIRLGQLLKLAGVAQSGSEAKALLAAESVSVNGELETRRGRQLHPGDTVLIGEQQLRVTRAAA